MDSWISLILTVHFDIRHFILDLGESRFYNCRVWRFVCGSYWTTGRVLRAALLKDLRTFFSLLSDKVNTVPIRHCKQK
jgi:hypothetical protein